MKGDLNFLGNKLEILTVWFMLKMERPIGLWSNFSLENEKSSILIFGRVGTEKKKNFKNPK